MAIIQAYKSLDTIRTTTTLLDDPDLTVTLLANTTYIFESYFIINTRDIATQQTGRFRFTAPGHTLGFYTEYRIASDTDGAGGTSMFMNQTPKAFSTLTTYSGGSDSRSHHHCDGIITVGGTGGTFALNWSSTATSTDQTTVQGSGWMMFQSI